ncbi:hypothetical protein [Ehrlichia japonica]|uniref:Uncharacterized protein n=1 Tax=Ehrlichia japonica TaxID=391036 RepID=X5GKL1_9RICK|nr:hypothetical protein [Ehrlichia japonica]AHX04681.1 hypothetical protein EHF_0630 [Ehrlichia japonica]
MKKSQLLYLFVACIILIAAIVLTIFLSKIYVIPSFNIIIGVAGAALSGIILFGITCAILHCQYPTTIHDVLPFVKKNEQVMLFIPLSDDQLNKLDLESDIVEIKYDRVESGININEDKNIVLNITQKKCGLWGKRTVDVVVDSNRKCMLLEDNVYISHMNSRGIAVLVNKKMSSIGDIVHKDGFRIKYPEMKDGVLSLACSYNVICSTLKDTLDMLRYRVEDPESYDYGYSIYELILKDLLIRFPYDIPTGEKDSRTGQSNGYKLAMALLTAFSTSKVLGNSPINEELVNSVALLKSYMAESKVTSYEEFYPELFERIRYKFCQRHEKIGSYGCLHNNYYTKYGVTFKEMLISSIRGGDSVLASMLAIASCHNGRGFTKTNDFFKEILSSVGCDDLVAEANRLIADGLHRKIDLSSCEFIKWKIFGALKVILTPSNTACSLDGLIYGARRYIMRKCYSSVTTLKCVPYSLIFRSIYNPVIMTGKESEQVVGSSNIEHVGVSHAVGM